MSDRQPSERDPGDGARGDGDPSARRPADRNPGVPAPGSPGPADPRKADPRKADPRKADPRPGNSRPGGRRSGRLRLRRAGPRYRPLSPLRDHLRESFWFAPLLTCIGAALLAGLTAWADEAVVTAAIAETGSASELMRFNTASKSVVSSVSSAMLTFIGVVFSISLVALQMAASQFSPRVLRLYVRSRLTKATFSVCLATFLYSLLVQLSYDDETDPAEVASVPVFSGLMAMVLVVLSLAMFVLYVQSTMRLLRVPHVIDRVATESVAVIGQYRLVPPDGQPPAEAVNSLTLLHEGRSGALRDINIRRLVRLARRHDLVFHMVPRIGDFITPGTPIVRVSGGSPPRPWRIASALNVGVERTMHQDLAFGFRQLVDIAIRALSPAVNDPTTAVQAIDRIHQLLGMLVRESFGDLQFRDRYGVVRLVAPVPDWECVVDLAFTEIRICGAGQPQVTRRLTAALDDLLRITPADRRPQLLSHRSLLERAVDEHVVDPENRAFARVPDRQGIG
ncbi:DUF2254 domain-containing protein [Kitasatospora sp. NBC_00240]|uniref:DUF2254 domain-containing protein n=1 Tax=Kitasatospora sp. NBC_00240 TaxID=2903567 RepID=UPI0022532F6D|nr:DUF2254 domain-containing protein [Kitasatospora sp. NBC_00240]MCX5214256.1 DUF2254 domain-containing protein [Kitasatospora sp. NBC_00240]